MAVAGCPLCLGSGNHGVNCLSLSLSIAEAFDHTSSMQLVPVVSGLLCVYAIGAIIGPYTASVLMGSLDQNALFTFVIMVDLGLMIYTIYRMSEREALPVEAQETFVMHTPNSIHGELDPRAEHQNEQNDIEITLSQVEQLAKSSPINSITFIRNVINKQSPWAIALIERVAEIDNIDTTFLFRSLAQTHPELSIDIVKRLSTSDNNQIEELVTWLAEQQPENIAAILTAMTESIHPKIPANLEPVTHQEIDTLTDDQTILHDSTLFEKQSLHQSIEQLSSFYRRSRNANCEIAKRPDCNRTTWVLVIVNHI